MFCVEPQAFALLFWRCMFARCYPKHGGHWYYEALGITEKNINAKYIWGSSIPWVVAARGYELFNGNAGIASFNVS